MTIRNPYTTEERLNRALEELSQLRTVVSALTEKSNQQEEVLTELLETWRGFPGSYYLTQAFRETTEEGQTGGSNPGQIGQREQLEGELIELYKQFEQVQGFAVGDYLDETRVYVLLRMELYDDQLMEHLTHFEAALEDNFPTFCLMIRHIPVGDIDLAMHLGQLGTLVWQRDAE